MSDKRKNMTLDELQTFINEKADAEKELQTDNAWKLHNAIMKKLAEGKVTVNQDKSISIELRYWRGDISNYDRDALESMLKASGLSYTDAYRNGWQGYNAPFPGVYFKFALVIGDTTKAGDE